MNTTIRVRPGLALIFVLLSVPALAASALPTGFVYLRDIDPTIVQDIRYAGSHNFVGRPVTGYLAAECILSEPAANALATAQRRLARKQLSLIVWVVIGRNGRSMISCGGGGTRSAPK